MIAVAAVLGCLGGFAVGLSVSCTFAMHKEREACLSLLEAEALRFQESGDVDQTLGAWGLLMGYARIRRERG
jgi:hypothetical protein